MNKFLTTTAFVLVAGSAHAGVGEAHTKPSPLSGDITTSITKGADGNFGATTTFGIDLTAGVVGTGVELAIDGDGNVAVDEWALGADIAGAQVTFGDQGSVFIEGENGATLATPAITESLAVAYGPAAVAVGFSDVTSDVTDISNVQGLFAMGTNVGGLELGLQTSGDYNLNSEEWLVGGRVETAVGGYAVGGAATYGSADEKIAFEADATVFGITGYLNGDADDLAQNVGGSYAMAVGDLGIDSGVNYNVDSGEVTPSVEIGFNF
jgi:hypothetical protein